MSGKEKLLRDEAHYGGEGQPTLTEPQIVMLEAKARLMTVLQRRVFELVEHYCEECTSYQYFKIREIERDVLTLVLEVFQARQANEILLFVHSINSTDDRVKECAQNLLKEVVTQKVKQYLLSKAESIS